jgi:hypothetical protein
LLSEVWLWLSETAKPKLKAFVQEARLSCSGLCHMGNAIGSFAASWQFSAGSRQ